MFSNSRSANLAQAACGLHDNTSRATGLEGSLKVASTPLQPHLHIGGAAPPHCSGGLARVGGFGPAIARFELVAVRQGKALRLTFGKGHPPASAIRRLDVVAGIGLPVALAASYCGSIRMLLSIQPRVNVGGLRPDGNRFADSVRDTLSPLITTQKTRRMSGRLPRGTATRTTRLSRSRSFASTTAGSSVPHSAKPGSTEIELCAFATPCTQGRQLSTPRHRSASETKSSDPPLQIHVAQNPCGLRILPAVGKSCASPPSDGPTTSSFRLLHGSSFVVWNDLCPPNHNQTNTYS